MKLAIEMAHELSVPLSVGSTALQAFLAAMAHDGWPDKEFWVMMDLFEEFSAVRVPRPDVQERGNPLSPARSGTA
jgi:hypothetical protein